MKHVIGLVGLFGLLLCLTGCTPTELTVTLDASVVALDALVSSVSAIGQINAGTATLITAWANVGEQDLEFATTELDSSDSLPLKLSKIVQQFSNFCTVPTSTCTAPPIPSTTATDIVLALNAASKALSLFLETISTSATATNTPAAKSFFESHPAKLTHGDKQNLAKIRVKLATLKAKIAKLKH